MVQRADTFSCQTRIWHGFTRNLLNEIDLANQVVAHYLFVKILQLSPLTMVSQVVGKVGTIRLRGLANQDHRSGYPLSDFDFFVPQLLVGFVGAGEFERISDDSLALLHAGDHV
jgi:hypothetical protein